MGLKVLHLSAQHRVYCRGNNALWLAKAVLLSAARVGESLLEYLEWSPVLEHFSWQPGGEWNSGHVGSVLSPHVEGLMKAVKLRKIESASLLLLQIPVLRAASNTSPHARLRLGMCVLAVVVSPNA